MITGKWHDRERMTFYNVSREAWEEFIKEVMEEDDEDGGILYRNKFTIKDCIGNDVEVDLISCSEDDNAFNNWASYNEGTMEIDRLVLESYIFAEEVSMELPKTYNREKALFKSCLVEAMFIIYKAIMPRSK